MAWIEKRKSKTGTKYRIGWDTGTPDNRQKKHSESFDDIEEAKLYKASKEIELATGMIIEPTKMTFGEYLDHWFPIHATTSKLEPTTSRAYQNIIDNHIKPQLGNIKLQKLSPMMIQEFYTKMLLEGRSITCKKDIARLNKLIKDSPKQWKKNIYKDKLNKANARLEKITAEGRTGLSSGTVRLMHILISNSLKQSVRWRNIAFNPATAVEAPKEDHKEIEYLKRDEIIRFIGCINQSILHGVFATAIMTGMRKGEILGLRWQDIDFKNGIIHVRQQLQYSKGAGYIPTDPKQNSRRDIPMPLPLHKIFRDAQKWQESIRSMLDEDTPWNEGNLVFVRENGQSWYSTKVRSELIRILEENGIKQIRFHGLRHSFATAARSSGMPIEDLQDMLGHANIGMTKKMYVHKDIEPLKKGMANFESYLGVNN